ncbi:hypothetical protein R8871_04065 [Paraburkholderia graminis C4D1M]|jgi:hypothetical protein|uniref:Uncharacterized protein n=1 Tax=Paraburkholderia graminis (strain ATCC 700544 / DSM 17151 / LMG 18924 / NCIMB 13744 / C4D1M) TaxID=396598 RepID=B1G6Z0_PARG4|nr:hypothetical protein BgramDRAFT_5111 [Paraburkholderia graminis C4D1M]CAB3709729.1 hypothetical protein R8871_04065 [Paraburkholderia graminis C4D1M]
MRELSVRWDIPLPDLHLVLQRPILPERRDACERSFANGRRCLVRELCLMSRHNHVGERHESLRDFVSDYLAREVAKKEIPLLFVHVYSKPAGLPCLRRVDGSLGVEQAPAARIDQYCTWLRVRAREARCRSVLLRRWRVRPPTKHSMRDCCSCWRVLCVPGSTGRYGLSGQTDATALPFPAWRLPCIFALECRSGA